MKGGNVYHHLSACNFAPLRTSSSFNGFHFSFTFRLDNHH